MSLKQLWNICRDIQRVVLSGVIVHLFLFKGKDLGQLYKAQEGQAFDVERTLTSCPQVSFHTCVLQNENTEQEVAEKLALPQ